MMDMTSESLKFKNIVAPTYIIKKLLVIFYGFNFYVGLIKKLLVILYGFKFCVSLV